MVRRPLVRGCQGGNRARLGAVAGSLSPVHQSSRLTGASERGSATTALPGRSSVRLPPGRRGEPSGPARRHGAVNSERDSMTLVASSCLYLFLVAPSCADVVYAWRQQGQLRALALLPCACLRCSGSPVGVRNVSRPPW